MSDLEQVIILEIEIESLQEKLEKAEKALRSIAANTCCYGCQEAKLVAQAALDDLSE